MQSFKGQIGILVTVAALAALVTSHGATLAARQGATTNLLVSANVIKKCWVTSQPLDFGNYDPVQAHSTAPLDGQATLTLACTKGTSVEIGLDNGANAQGKVRRMSAGKKEFLSYELYKDGSRGQRWGDTGNERFDAGVAPSKDPRYFTVYGRVPGGQDVPEGDFQDTVLVTVHF